jgi:hypothetical protein
VGRRFDACIETSSPLYHGAIGTLGTQNHQNKPKTTSKKLFLPLF